jgi:hypothetical protein
MKVREAWPPGKRETRPHHENQAAPTVLDKTSVVQAAPLRYIIRLPKNPLGRPPCPKPI